MNTFLFVRELRTTV